MWSCQVFLTIVCLFRSRPPPPSPRENRPDQALCLGLVASGPVGLYTVKKKRKTFHNIFLTVAWSLAIGGKEILHNKLSDYNKIFKKNKLYFEQCCILQSSMPASQGPNQWFMYLNVELRAPTQSITWDAF